MGTLYLVRHGQASLGMADYDQLSALGHQQSLRLGEHFRQKGLRFEAVLSGTLRRHQQTHAAISEGMGLVVPALQLPELNEYDPAALIASVQPGPLEPPDSPARVRRHFRLLRASLVAWMTGAISPQGMPGFAEFQAGVGRALDHVSQHCSGPVLLVSSGGPIASAIGLVLGTPPEATADLNLRLRNSALTEFAFNSKRHSLLTYNTLPHLELLDPDWWVSYA